MSSPDTSLLKSHKASPEERSGSSQLLRTLRMLTSLDDIRSLRFWKAVVAEMVGVIFLVFVGCGSCTGWAGAEAPLNGSFRSDVSEELKNPSVVQIALCFGLIVGTMVWCIGHVSGGHINPAVTAAMCVTRKISLARGLFYVIAQCAGAILGAGVLKAVTPSPYSGSLGSTLVSPLITPGQGVGIEFLITFVLVLTVFASCDGRRTDLAGSAPLTIGLSVTACHLAAVSKIYLTRFLLNICITVNSYASSTHLCQCKIFRQYSENDVSYQSEIKMYILLLENTFWSF